MNLHQTENREFNEQEAMSRLASAIVHEIRNPLSSIKIGLTTLARRLQFAENDKRCLDLSIVEVEKLEKKLKELLKTLEPGVLRCIHVDIHTIIDQIIEQIAYEFKEAGIEIQQEYAKGNYICSLDVQRFSQALYHILLNAKEAMDKGGLLSVQSRLSEDRKTIIILINDSGKGMSPYQLDRFFDPFFTTKTEASGLGIPLAQKIIRSHGGAISVTSGTNAGTTVFIELPLLEANLSEC